MRTQTHMQTAFSRTTWVGRYQKDKPFWILLKQEMVGWQWHMLNHMQIICTLLQTDNHASTSSLHIFYYRPDALPAANQQRQSTNAQKHIPTSGKADRCMSSSPQRRNTEDNCVKIQIKLRAKLLYVNNMYKKFQSLKFTNMCLVEIVL